MSQGRIERAVSALRAAWAALRHAFRDDAYERYLVEHRRTQPGEPPLDPAAFRKTQALRNLGRCCGG